MPSSRLATGARGARARTERPHPLTGDEIVMKMQNEISRENLQELSRLSAFCLVAPRSGAEIQQCRLRSEHINYYISTTRTIDKYIIYSVESLITLRNG